METQTWSIGPETTTKFLHLSKRRIIQRARPSMGLNQHETRLFCAVGWTVGLNEGLYAAISISQR